MKGRAEVQSIEFINRRQNRTTTMQIYVDADACPVVGIVEKTAERDKLPVILLCDTKHVLHLDYSEEIIIGVGYIKMFHAI